MKLVSLNSIGTIFILFLSNGFVNSVMGSALSDFENFGETGFEHLAGVQEQFDYLCMQIESRTLGTDREMEDLIGREGYDDEMVKNCIELLDELDQSERQELIDKYGELYED